METMIIAGAITPMVVVYVRYDQGDYGVTKVRNLNWSLILKNNR